MLPSITSALKGGYRFALSNCSLDLRVWKGVG